MPPAAAAPPPERQPTVAGHLPVVQAVVADVRAEQFQDARRRRWQQQQTQKKTRRQRVVRVSRSAVATVPKDRCSPAAQTTSRI